MMYGMIPDDHPAWLRFPAPGRVVAWSLSSPRVQPVTAWVWPDTHVKMRANARMRNVCYDLELRDAAHCAVQPRASIMPVSLYLVLFAMKMLPWPWVLPCATHVSMGMWASRFFL
jgi:hypothetical protein